MSFQAWARDIGLLSFRDRWLSRGEPDGACPTSTGALVNKPARRIGSPLHALRAATAPWSRRMADPMARTGEATSIGSGNGACASPSGQLVTSNRNSQGTDVRCGLPVFPPIFSVIHLETNGLNPERSDITRIGALRVYGHESRRVALSTCTLELDVLPAGTSAAGDGKGTTAERAIGNLLAFLGDAPVVFRHAAVDGPLIAAAARRVGLDFDNTRICALDLVRQAWPQRDSWEMVKVLSRAGRMSDTRATSNARGTLGAYVVAVNHLRTERLTRRP